MTALTGKVLAFQAGKCSEEDVIPELLVQTDHFLKTRKHWAEDDREDFIGLFYEEIKVLPSHFVYSGKPFENYLFTSLRYLEKSKKRTEKQQMYRDTIFCSDAEHTRRGIYRDRENGWQLSDRPPAYRPCALQTDRQGRLKRDSDRNRVLYLVLVNCHFIKDIHRAQACKLLDIPEKELTKMLVDMKHESMKGLIRYNLLRCRKRYCWFRMRRLDLRITEAETPELRKELTAAWEQTRKKFAGAEFRLAHCHPGPSHRQIARYLGISKGTVDSGLYYLTRAMEKN